MKIQKFIPVALAVLTLASCSGDDLFNDGKAPVQKVKDGLTVTVDEITFDGAVATRQGNTASGGVVWENGDQINVYDDKLQLFDEYAFATNKFVGANDPDETNLEGDPSYALFPADRVDYAGNKKAVMTIPELVIYDDESEFGDGANRVYVSNLPLWGTATGAYPEANVDLHLLTSVLRINIKNAFADNINFLKVEAQDGVAIQGAFEADLSDPANAVLKEGSSSLTTGNVMYVDLRGVPSYMTYLYLPIIARQYDYLKVYTTASTVEATPIEANSKQIVKALKALPAADWTCIRNWEADGGVTFQKGAGKSLYKETQYKLENVNTTEELSEALKMYAADYLSAADRDQTQDPENLTLTISNATNKGLAVTRTSENYKDDYTIYIPKFPNSIKSVTINIPDGISAGATVPDLQIVDANIKDCYEGKVIINATKIESNAMTMTVNLPATSLTIDGDFTNNLNAINIKNVKDMTFGNGDATATIIAAATTVTVNSANSLTIAGDCTFNAGLNLIQTENIKNGGVTIAAGGNYTGEADKALKVLDANVRVLGTAKDVFQFASTGTVYIGANEVNGTVTDGVSNGNVFRLRTIGKVYIANATESEAVSASLAPLGNNTITLKQGYVKKIKYTCEQEFNDPASGYYVKPLANLTKSDLEAKLITIKLDEPFNGVVEDGVQNQGLTAIGLIDSNLLSYSADDYHFIKFTESKWGGQTITAATFGATYAQKTDDTDGNVKIYTASELASMGQAQNKEKVLYNDFDLQSKNWTEGIVTTYPFEGQDPRWDATTTIHNNRFAKIHTIKNLKLKKAGTTSNYENVGLFAAIGTGGTMAIENFIIDGVSCNLTKAAGGKEPENIGIVCGKAWTVNATADLQFNNITIKNGGALGSSTVNVKNVGGLIGIVDKSGTAGKVTVKGTTSITTTSISGYVNLGGVIGKVVYGDADIAVATGDALTVNVGSFAMTTAPLGLDQAEARFGTVGTIIGSIQDGETTAATNVAIGGAANVTATDVIAGNRGDLNFKYNYVVNKEDNPNSGLKENVQYRYHGSTKIGGKVGYSTKYSSLTVGGKYFIVGKAQVSLNGPESYFTTKSAFNNQAIKNTTNPDPEGLLLKSWVNTKNEERELATNYNFDENPANPTRDGSANSADKGYFLNVYYVSSEWDANKK